MRLLTENLRAREAEMLGVTSINQAPPLPMGGPNQAPPLQLAPPTWMRAARAAVAPAALHLLKRLMLHSFPRRQQRGRSMKSTRGLGLTVKCRKRLTTSRSTRIRLRGALWAQERVGKDGANRERTKTPEGQRHKTQPLFSANCHGSKQPRGGGGGGC